MESQIRDGAMKMMVFEELVYQEALRRGMTISPAKMQKAEADFRRTFDSPDQYTEFLRGEFHGSDQLLRAKIRRSLLIEALLKAEVEDKSAISPVELQAYYDKNSARFAHPESYTFQSISILPPEKASGAQLKEGRERADKALKEARATKSAVEFGLLAEKTSDDDFRVVMGQHKPVPVDQLPPQVLKALRAMKPGDVSDAIQMDEAFTILRLNAHAPAGETKFDEVRADLKKQMYQTRREAARNALDRQLRQKAKIEELNQVAEKGN
jgi:peptidyl-prolyl cis-trans isomerase C